VLARADGRPALSRLFALVEQMADLRRAGHEVLLVSSGAVGLGRERLALTPPLSLVDRQACAAVGQSRLMALYEQGFSRHGMECAQVLLTRGDFDSRQHYLNLRNALSSLLNRRVIPVINENDVVSTDELKEAEGAQPIGDAGPARFGDNDQLSALVAAKLDASLLILLTDVAGVFADRDESARDPHASPIAELDEFAAQAMMATLPKPADGVSRGGMGAKLAAAGIAVRSGCHTVIASGMVPEILTRICAGEGCGTWLRARPGPAGRRRWIAFASTPRGKLFLDTGAVRAITERGASLLAAGVTRLSGDFRRGDVVELCDAVTGHTLGRGIVHCDAAQAAAWAAGQPPADARNRDALVHRDNLTLLGRAATHPDR
jgi:glutamate 5-kinase